MKDSTKKTLRRIGELIVTIITALLTTMGAHATGLCEMGNQLETLPQQTHPQPLP